MLPATSYFPNRPGLIAAPQYLNLLAKVYGRDAWDGQFLASIWSSLWHRGERPTLGFGRLQQVEHEAFVTLLAERWDPRDAGLMW